jgi:ribosomal protein S18 acetylase RimI-like enzyme
MTTPAITLRRATEADLPAVVAMLADDHLGAKREDMRLPLVPGYLAAFRAIEADANQFLAVAEVGGDVVGTLQLSFLPGLSKQGAWRGQIEAVRVARNQRNGGIGQHMILWAIDQCRARGCRSVQLTTDVSRTDAHRFYDRLGFVASHKGYKLSLD